jgi:hypothetical protein
MYFAIGVDPTKDTAEIFSWRSKASTAALSPCTTLNTPSGRPASLKSSAMRTEADGTFSEGLSTKVLPQAIAIGNIHKGTITGKLNGVMPAHTPTGWRTVCVSTCVPTFSAYSPFRRCGMPQANSTTSIPRCTEPMASGSVLPCSSVTMRARSFWLSCNS